MRQRNQERRIAQEQLQQMYARREMIDRAILSLEQKLQDGAVKLQLIRNDVPVAEQISLAIAV